MSNKWLAFGGLGVALLLYGCDMPPTQPVTQAPVPVQPKISAVRMQEDVAMYMGKPLHKAFFLNMTGQRYVTWSSHAFDDAQAATDDGERHCRELASTRFHADPNRCVPVYIDEQKVLDWTMYLQ